MVRWQRAEGRSGESLSFQLRRDAFGLNISATRLAKAKRGSPPHPKGSLKTNQQGIPINDNAHTVSALFRLPYLFQATPQIPPCPTLSPISKPSKTKSPKPKRKRNALLAVFN
nr:hypothetical protein [uncultured Kingella sp.]